MHHCLRPERLGHPHPQQAEFGNVRFLCVSVLLEELPLPPENKKQFSVQRTQVICTSQVCAAL